MANALLGEASRITGGVPLQRIATFMIVGVTAGVTGAAGCASQPVSPSTSVVDNAGTRNDAFRAAARAHGLPEDWLVAVGYQQGRFERADGGDAGASTGVPPQDTASSLMIDTPVDETDGTAEDGAATGDDDQMPPAFGVMYLSEDQIQQAAVL